MFLSCHFSGIEQEKAKVHEHDSRLESHGRRLANQRIMLEHTGEQIQEQRLVTEAHTAQLEHIRHQLPAALHASSDGNVQCSDIFYSLDYKQIMCSFCVQYSSCPNNEYSEMQRLLIGLG